MSTVDIFACPVVYKYKTRLCSFSVLFVLVLTLVTIICPLIIVYHTGGFWLKNRIYVESPLVNFAHKYFLIGEKDIDAIPITCSTFPKYKDNPINDDCTIVKVQEIDTNKDRRMDVLKFEARFYTDRPLRTLRLLLFFHIELRELIEASLQTIAVLDCSPNRDVREIGFTADLRLRQRSLLQIDNFPESYNYSVEIGDKSIAEALSENARKKLSAHLTNSLVTWETGFSRDEPVVVGGEIFYAEETIRYRPSLWQELKWAWIQYSSIFLVFAYASTRILRFLFTTGRLKSHVVVPWKIQ